MNSSKMLLTWTGPKWCSMVRVNGFVQADKRKMESKILKKWPHTD